MTVQTGLCLTCSKTTLLIFSAHLFGSGREPTSQAMGPVDKDGMLHYFYKKHVKPKKQHEIRNLAKVCLFLAHLSRMLTGELIG